MAKKSIPEICQRLVKVRLETTGPRGKSQFAKMLDISPSTYEYYEAGRVPPVHLLIKISAIANIDLVWLLTGEKAGGSGVSADHPVVQRAAALLADKPEAAQALATFLEILAESLKFPPKEASGAPPAAEAPAPAAEAQATPSIEAGPEARIPILGRSAAGLPQFWAPGAKPGAVTTLDELIARHAGQPARQVRPAVAEGRDAVEPLSVQLVTLAWPAAEEPCEFIIARPIKALYGDAFATRIDGDSMAPDIRHGDLVILSPSVPAADGRAAVVQLTEQIGVTCKLYRRQGDLVHLIPINEQYTPQAFPAERIVWALRVLARVRPCLPGQASAHSNPR